MSLKPSGAKNARLYLRWGRPTHLRVIEIERMHRVSVTGCQGHIRLNIVIPIVQSATLRLIGVKGLSLKCKSLAFLVEPHHILGGDP